ncbi:lysine N(6)-hydroxylase/L-ornithine N(5)-oxygenase family protein [Burkholderia sp. Tr-862]|uniref:NAD(P)-binding domain-containing protein n=1 Tax=Burkholderia sp. Tr-862 TaxID=2608331 RepID=UPI00141A3419|nr:NAD(P)-binding domain-containing protein [Burkholderia sp. Tr-862]NIF41894.1 lysine N(6)-hydroxylase/L-ornithine N(5)-oxygenase family protein [Burkholderia sp. Tr-862]
MPSTDTVIIGAGPYGLSLATHLKAAGVPHQILGQPMCAWRNYMPPGMLMRSEAFASNLSAPQRGYTLKDYCRVKGIQYQPVGMKLTLETFVDYGLWFQSNLAAETRPVEVVDLRRSDDGFNLSLSDGSTLDARRVVMALGLKGFAHTPPVLQGLPDTYVSHSEKYGSLTWAAGRDIVIVGGGQSALGLAALLNEVGASVRVLVRDQSVEWNPTPETERSFVSKMLSPDAGLGRGWRTHVLCEYPYVFHALSQRLRKDLIERLHGPSGAWWLHDRVVDKIPIAFDAEVRSAAIDDDKVALRVANGNGESTVTASHVIVATGFKTDMTRHTFISKEIMDSISLFSGGPELTRHFETTVRGLYVIGPASAQSFGPVMRFVYGAKHAAPHVAWHIGKAHRRETAKIGWRGTAGQLLEPTSERDGSL